MNNQETTVVVQVRDDSGPDQDDVCEEASNSSIQYLFQIYTPQQQQKFAAGLDVGGKAQGPW